MIKLSKKLKVSWATVSIEQVNQDALTLTFIPYTSTYFMENYKKKLNSQS